MWWSLTGILSHNVGQIMWVVIAHPWQKFQYTYKLIIIVHVLHPLFLKTHKGNSAINLHTMMAHISMVCTTVSKLMTSYRGFRLLMELPWSDLILRTKLRTWRVFDPAWYVDGADNPESYVVMPEFGRQDGETTPSLSRLSSVMRPCTTPTLYTLARSSHYVGLEVISWTLTSGSGMVAPTNITNGIPMTGIELSDDLLPSSPPMDILTTLSPFLNVTVWDICCSWPYIKVIALAYDLVTIWHCELYDYEPDLLGTCCSSESVLLLDFA